MDEAGEDNEEGKALLPATSPGSSLIRGSCHVTEVRRREENFGEALIVSLF